MLVEEERNLKTVMSLDEDLAANSKGSWRLIAGVLCFLLCCSCQPGLGQLLRREIPSPRPGSSGSEKDQGWCLPGRSLEGRLQGTVGDRSIGSSGVLARISLPVTPARGHAPGWFWSSSPRTELETGGEGRRWGAGLHRSPTSHFARLRRENAARWLGFLCAGKDGVFPRKEEGAC